MFNNFTSCNQNCVQPYVYGLLVLPTLLTAFVAAITAYVKGRSSAGQSFLIAFVASLVVIVLVWYLLQWLCKNNHHMIAWLVAILPLILPLVYGYHFGMNTHYSWECHKKLRSTLSGFKCDN